MTDDLDDLCIEPLVPMVVGESVIESANGKTYHLGMLYLIGFARQVWIHCYLCGMRSYHPDDVRHRYCGRCGIFLVDRN